MANNNKDVKRGIVLYIDGKEVKNNARSIQAEMRALKKEIDGCTVGSDEYIAKTKQYKALNAILQEHKANLKGIETQTKQNAVTTENWIAKGVSLFNKYSVAIMGFAAAFTGVAMKIADFRKKNMEKESSQANLQALTGLDESSIAWLTQQAEVLSTTMDKTGLRVKKSSQEILDAYTMVGSKKPELLQDKEALNAVTIEAMRLAEAAKIDLTDAVSGVTLAMNQYGAAANEASRYVNVLAAGSKMGAVGVATQTESIVKAGVAAATAKVPVEQLVGVIETLGEKGIEGSIAGTQLKTFLLKLESGAKETRPSVVGLQKALETLAAKHMDATSMTKQFGLEAYVTAQALISSADKVKYYTNAVTDTNVATEQAAINSNTMEAKMAQLRNQINETGMVLAKDLAPVFSKFTNIASKFVMSLPPLVKFIKEYGEELAIVVSTLALYTLRMQIASKATAAWNAVVTFSTSFSKAYSAALIQLRLMQSGATAAQITYTRVVASSNVIQRAAIAVTALFKAAMFALKGETQAATASMRAFAVASSSTGVGAVLLLLGAVTAAVTALNKYNKKQKEVAESAKAMAKAKADANKEYDKERAKIEALSRTIHDGSQSYAIRKKAIDKMREIVPEYHAELTKEGKLYKDNKKAIDDYLVSFKKRVLMQHIGEQKEDTMIGEYEAEREYWKAWREWQQNHANYKAAMDKYRAGDRSSIIEDNEGAVYEFKSGGEWMTVGRMNKQWERVQELKKKWDEQKKAVEDVIDEENDLKKKFGDAMDSVESTTTTTSSDDDKKKHKTDDKVKKAIELVELEIEKKRNLLRESYVRGEMDKRKYNEEMQKLEMERLQKTLQVAGLEPGKVAEIQGKIYEMQLKAKEEVESMSFNVEDDEDLKKYQEQTVKIEDELLDRISKIDAARSLGVLSQEQYEAKMTEVWAKYDADMQKNHDDYVKKVRERKDETTEELHGLAKTFEEAGLEIKDIAEDIGESIGEALAGAITGKVDNVKSAFKSLLTVILDSIEKMVIAATVSNSLLTITGVGTAAGLKNLMKLAGIKVAFAALKSAVNSFDVGGYTGDGRWNEAAGIVHKNEFVANRYALANPAVKNVLNVVDHAQKNGTVTRLTSSEITAAANSSVSTVNQVLGNKEMIGLMRQCIASMETVRERFDKPIIAETYATGKGGTMTAQDLVEQMNNNASRHR